MKVITEWFVFSLKKKRKKNRGEKNLTGIKLETYLHIWERPKSFRTFHSAAAAAVPLFYRQFHLLLACTVKERKCGTRSCLSGNLTSITLERWIPEERSSPTWRGTINVRETWGYTYSFAHSLHTYICEVGTYFWYVRTKYRGIKWERGRGEWKLP